MSRILNKNLDFNKDYQIVLHKCQLGKLICSVHLCPEVRIEYVVEEFVDNGDDYYYSMIGKFFDNLDDALELYNEILERSIDFYEDQFNIS